jgi:hypothetical protein
VEGTFSVNPRRPLPPVSVDLVIAGSHYCGEELNNPEYGLRERELPIEAFFNRIVVTLTSLCRMDTLVSGH